MVDKVCPAISASNCTLYCDKEDGDCSTCDAWAKIKKIEEPKKTCENCYYHHYKDYETPCKDCPHDFQYTAWEPEGLFNISEKQRIVAWLSTQRKEYPCKTCGVNDTCQRQYGVQVGHYGCLETDEIRKHNRTVDELTETIFNMGV